MIIMIGTIDPNNQINRSINSLCVQWSDNQAPGPSSTNSHQWISNCCENYLVHPPLSSSSTKGAFDGVKVLQCCNYNCCYRGWPPTTAALVAKPLTSHLLHTTIVLCLACQLVSFSTINCILQCLRFAYIHYSIDTKQWYGSCMHNLLTYASYDRKWYHITS